MDQSEISIRLCNTTDESKIVLVFGREHAIPLTPAIVDIAWRKIAIGPQGQATFEYPKESSVGAFYTKDDGTIVNMGPYLAPPGSTWTVVLQSEFDDGTMVKEDKAPPNPHGIYMIYNRPPAAWTGRRINAGVYKDGKLLMVKNNLRVGDYCELKPTQKLYMCCMSSASARGTDIRTIINPDTRKGSVGRDDVDYIDVEFTPLVQIDLAHFPNGVHIDVTEIEASGQIKFIPKSSC